MRYCSGVVLIFAAIGFVSTSGGAEVMPGDDFYSHAQVSATALQKWYNPQGLWDTTGWWNSANCLDAIESVIVAGNGRAYSGVIANTFDLSNTNHFLNEYYDDEGWWALTWIRAFDLTGDPRYLAAAKTIFDDLKASWDDHCNGGIWWSKKKAYKNAIANELFLLVAIRLSERTPGDAGPGSYLDWAQREWTWFNHSGMINARNLVNDGLTDDCENNYQTTWTYNQGVLIAGLTELYTTTGEASCLAKANALASASMAVLVDKNGVLSERYEAQGIGGGDAPQFKGVFIRYLAELYDTTGNPALRDYLVRNARAVWRDDRDTNNNFGLHWSGPVDAVDAARQSSAMSVFLALAGTVTTNCPFAAGAGGNDFNHEVGRPAGTLGWQCGGATDARAGSMLSGPYIEFLPAGKHTVHFRMSLSEASSSRERLASLMVRDDQTGKTLAQRDVRGRDFSAGEARDFALSFKNQTTGDPLEFQVKWNAVADAPELTLADVTVDGFQNWTAANLAHELGRLDVQGNWTANPLQDAASGWLARGPGASDLAASEHEARFELKVDNFNHDTETVATISVVDIDANATVATRDLKRSDFPNVLYQTFKLPFNAVAGHHYDFRTYWHRFAGAPRMTLRCVVVS